MLLASARDNSGKPEVCCMCADGLVADSPMAPRQAAKKLRIKNYEQTDWVFRI
jgi:hypothetical protein